MNKPPTPDKSLAEIDQQVIEKLAEIEHERWSDWQKWCHKILRENVFGVDSLEKVLERWDKQIATPYPELSEAEKQSDRDQVERYLPIINSLIAAHEKEVLESIMARVVELTILDKNMSFEQLSFLYERVLQDRLASLEGKE